MLLGHSTQRVLIAVPRNWLRSIAKVGVSLIVSLVVGAIPAIAIAEPAVKVGFILPLSGEWSSLGSGIRNAAVLAQADARKRDHEVTLYFEDNRGDLASSARLASQLIDFKKVDALVSIISGVGRILQPIANRSKVIHVGICSEPEVADGRYSFINYLTAEQGVTKFLEHFTSVYGQRKSLAVVLQNESGFHRISKTLQSRASPSVTISSIQEFNGGTSDFRSLLLRLSHHKPDAILLLGLSPTIELLAKQARSIGITAPFTSIESFGLANDRSQFEGAWFVDSAVPAASFVTRYEREFGTAVTPGVGHSYDTVSMLLDAFTQATAKSSAVERFRAISDFQGVTGVLRVQRDGIIWGDASLKVIRDGEARLVDVPPDTPAKGATRQ